MSPRCLVCPGSVDRVLYRLPPHSILVCEACAQVYLFPLPDEEEIRSEFAQLYTSGRGSVPELRSYYAFCYEDEPTNPLVQLYEHWLDLLEEQRRPGSLLDIGCGTGLFMSVARRRGWAPFGLDECEEATRYARDHFGCDVRTGEFAQLTGWGSFDAITMWDVLEHSRTPVELLDCARRSLAPGGILALATPNQRNILDLIAGGLYRLSAGRLTGPLRKQYVTQHFLYFTPETLTSTLGRAGLDAVRLEPESTDLRRLTLSPPMRLVLRGLFRVARWTRLENRLLVLARETRT